MAGQGRARALTLVGATVVAIGVVLALDARATLLGQHGLGLGVALLLVWSLRGADPRERAIVLGCVIFSTAAELFCTQVWGLYRYRLGNVPLYVPPGHGLICLCSLTVARVEGVRRRRRAVLAVTAAVALGWSGIGLFQGPRPDVEGALYLPIFLPLLLFTTRGIEHATTYMLASLVELAGTHFDTWAWADVQPWLGVPAGNPPSGAAGGYCTFTLGALALAPLVSRVLASSARLARAARESPPRFPAAARGRAGPGLGRGRRAPGA